MRILNIDELEIAYKGVDVEHDINLFNKQSAFGTKEEAEEAYDENGEFCCIDWYDCSTCPARRSECFL